MAFPLAPTGPLAEFMFLRASDTHVSEESLARSEGRTPPVGRLSAASLGANYWRPGQGCSSCAGS